MFRFFSIVMRKKNPILKIVNIEKLMENFQQNKKNRNKYFCNDANMWLSFNFFIAMI